MRSASITVLTLAAATLLSIAASPFPAESKPSASHRQWEQYVQSLVRQLGDENFGRREAAQRALLNQVPKILPVLDKLTSPTDAEILNRLRGIRYQLKGFLEDIRRCLAALPEIGDSLWQLSA